MTKEYVINEVARLRNEFGTSICTDPEFINGLARYTFQPGEVCGYIQEYDLEEGKERHCGLGPGCFWTEWEQI